jgi:hypothetical protein
MTVVMLVFDGKENGFRRKQQQTTVNEKLTNRLISRWLQQLPVDNGGYFVMGDFHFLICCQLEKETVCGGKNCTLNVLV